MYKNYKLLQEGEKVGVKVRRIWLHKKKSIKLK